MRIINLHSLEPEDLILTDSRSVNAAAFHPTENILLSGSRDAHLRIWDTTIWKTIDSVPAHNYAIYSICYSADRKVFFTASRDKSIKVWNADNFSFLQKADKLNSDGHQHSVNKIISFDKWLISCGDDKKIIGWKIIG
jgi:WD40 repeat protein